MERAPNIIEITATDEQTITADRAELLVAVHGSSLVTGTAVLKKAKEVSRIVEELRKCGVTDDDIGLEGVHAEVSSGIPAGRFGCRQHAPRQPITFVRSTAVDGVCDADGLNAI